MKASAAALCGQTSYRKSSCICATGNQHSQTDRSKSMRVPGGICAIISKAVGKNNALDFEKSLHPKRLLFCGLKTPTKSGVTSFIIKTEPTAQYHCPFIGWIGDGNPALESIAPVSISTDVSISCQNFRGGKPSSELPPRWVRRMFWKFKMAANPNPQKRVLGLLPLRHQNSPLCRCLGTVLNCNFQARFALRDLQTLLVRHLWAAHP